MQYQLHHGDSKQVLKQYPAGHFSSIVTDPPYGLGKQPDPHAMFQAWYEGADYSPGGSGIRQREWDCFVPQPSLWKEAWRVLKPGGYLLAFAGTRTLDLMTLSLRFAGFEIQDVVRSLVDGGEVAPAWVYAQGRPATKTRLKPGWEPVIVAYKPGQGVPAMNIPACRVPTAIEGTTRWPANVLHDGSAAVLDEFASYGERSSGGGREGEPGKRNYPSAGNTFGAFAGREDGRLFTPAYADSGTAERFFFSPKASPRDRSEGCRHLLWHLDKANLFGAVPVTQAEYDALPEEERGDGNVHPTVKPTELMRWLVRLVTPKGGKCLDLFCGSGSTGKACAKEQIDFVGIDLSEEALLIADARIQFARQQQYAAAPLLPPRKCENKSAISLQ